MRKIIAAIILVSIMQLVFVGTAFAQEKVNPDAGFSYKTKRLKEKFSLLFKFSPNAKVKYYESLLNKRFWELKYIVENKQYAYLETTSQRYEAGAGVLTEFVVSKKLTSEKEHLITYFTEQQKEIEKIRDNFSSDSAEWRLIMNDYNSLELYKTKLLSI